MDNVFCDGWMCIRFCVIPRHATGSDDDACRVLQLLRSKIHLKFVGVTSQSLIFRDHTLCKIPRHATGGDDDAYRVLQLLRSKIRLKYSTRIRSWISESSMLQHTCAERMPRTCHHASFIDTLPLTNQRGLRSVGSLKTCHYPVTPSGNSWHPVTIQMSSHVQWQQVASSHDSNVQWQRCLLVAVRSHFGLRLERRNNPERASNRILGRRIRQFFKHASVNEISFFELIRPVQRGLTHPRRTYDKWGTVGIA
jgi:hypothetical protein